MQEENKRWENRKCRLVVPVYFLNAPQILHMDYISSERQRLFMRGDKSNIQDRQCSLFICFHCREMEVLVIYCGSDKLVVEIGLVVGYIC